MVVDPGGGLEKIKAALAEKGVEKTAVLLTHGHFDHILVLPALKKEGAEVYIHAEDAAMLANERSLAEEVGLPPLETVKPDFTLHGGETLRFGDMTFTVIHTPGHTRGGCCYDLDGKYLFTGDTLFEDGYGRTDFYGGSSSSLVASLAGLFALEGDRIVYPGHGGATALSRERRSNPILSEL